MNSRLKTLGEFGLIKRLKKILPPLPGRRWLAGIGEDTSVLKLRENHYQLLTHDMLLEGVHFEAKTLKEFSDLGWKALAINLSDIAAMGGVPQEAVVGLGIPNKAKLSEIDALYRGLKKCSQRYHCPIVGGDTNRSKGGWVVSVSLTGFCAREPVLRSGAEMGDTLWVTGKLGEAALGFLLRKKKSPPPGSPAFFRRWARPEPRLIWAQRMQETSWVDAMIDLSDGLAGDLARLSEASRIAFSVEVTRLPRSRSLTRVSQKLKSNELSLLLEGGEDYELLFTIQKGRERAFSEWAKQEKIPVTQIGKTISGKKNIFVAKGTPIKGTFQGFRHF